MVSRMKWREFEDVAEFGEEHLIVGALAGSGVFPAGDEGVDLLGCGGRHGVEKGDTRRDAGGLQQFIGSVARAGRFKEGAGPKSSRSGETCSP